MVLQAFFSSFVCAMTSCFWFLLVDDLPLVLDVSF